MSNDARDRLVTYLDDHWAGAGGGTALARRLHRHNADTAWGERLRGLAEEIEADDEVLHEVRAAIGRCGGELKRAIARLGETITRLPQDLGGYTPLSRVLEAEAMMVGVAGKKRLWAALSAACGNDERLAEFDFDALESSAGAQLDLLAEFHEAAARIAFGVVDEDLLAPAAS